tara:strand:+ start:10754 stop:11314 length:561 start_codon:yes stop_codon:yes gene_type:complete
MIHKTYSKADLLELIDTFSIRIDNMLSQRKSVIALKVWTYISNPENPLCFDNSGKLFIDCNDRGRLIEIVKGRNPYKKLSVKQKNNVMAFCKDIIHYCNHGYLLENTKFKSFKNIVQFMDEIESYGDIPSVRRACRLMNLCPHATKKWNPEVSIKVVDDIQKKKDSKVKVVNHLIKREGSFCITFD